VCKKVIQIRYEKFEIKNNVIKSREALYCIASVEQGFKLFYTNMICKLIFLMPPDSYKVS
jgi:hypothetical protein